MGLPGIWRASVAAIWPGTSALISRLLEPRATGMHWIVDNNSRRTGVLPLEAQGDDAWVGMRRGGFPAVNRQIQPALDGYDGHRFRASQGGFRRLLKTGLPATRHNSCRSRWLPGDESYRGLSACACRRA